MSDDHFELGRDWPALVDILRGYADGTISRHDTRLSILSVFGLTERLSQTKPCPTCGTARHDFSYDRITQAGRVLLAAVGHHGEGK